MLTASTILTIKEQVIYNLYAAFPYLPIGRYLLKIMFIITIIVCVTICTIIRGRS